MAKSTELKGERLEGRTRHGRKDTFSPVAGDANPRRTLCTPPKTWLLTYPGGSFHVAAPRQRVSVVDAPEHAMYMGRVEPHFSCESGGVGRTEKHTFSGLGHENVRKVHELVLEPPAGKKWGHTTASRRSCLSPAATPVVFGGVKCKQGRYLSAEWRFQHDKQITARAQQSNLRTQSSST